MTKLHTIFLSNPDQLFSVPEIMYEILEEDQEKVERALKVTHTNVPICRVLINGLSYYGLVGAFVNPIINFEEVINNLTLEKKGFSGKKEGKKGKSRGPYKTRRMTLKAIKARCLPKPKSIQYPY